MSLISDALKKARQEAARQDSYRQGVPYAVGAADPRPARAPWISLLAGLGAGCILAAAIFAMAFFAGWGPFHKPATETQVAAAPAAPVTLAPAAPAPQPVASPSQPSEPAAAVVTPPSLAKPVAVETPAPKPAPEPPKREPEAVKPVPQAPAPAAPRPDPRDIARGSGAATRRGGPRPPRRSRPRRPPNPLPRAPCRKGGATPASSPCPEGGRSS